MDQSIKTYARKKDAKRKEHHQTGDEKGAKDYENEMRKNRKK